MAEDMMDFDDVIEEEAAGDDGLVVTLSVFTSIFIVIAIVVWQWLDRKPRSNGGMRAEGKPTR